MRGNLSFTHPLEQRARLHLQVLRSFNCGKPFGFHLSPFSRSGNVGSRRLRGRLGRALCRKRTRFLHMVAAITVADLLEDVPRTLPEPPFDFRSAPRNCKFPTPYPTSTARHKECSSHTSHPSYSGVSGFIAKVPRVCEALVELCGLSLRALTGAPSTGPLNFAMYPERAVGLIFIPFSPSR